MRTRRRRRVRSALPLLGLVAGVGLSCTESKPAAVDEATMSTVATTTPTDAVEPVDTPSSARDDVSPSYSDAMWWLRAAPQAEHRELWLVVEERDCASGQTAEDRTEIDVNETDAEITLVVRVRAYEGEGEPTCPENPPTFVTLPLAQPVGDRTVIGGSGQANLEYGIDATVPLRRDVPRVLPNTASMTVVGHDAIVDRLCTNPDDSFADVSYWETTGAYSTGAEVVAAAMEHFELTAEGWHVVEFARPSGRNEQIWTQYHDGDPIAVVDVLPVELGWIGGASLCSLAPDDWQPDASPAELFRDDPTLTTPLLDVTELLSLAGAEQIDADTWEFPDPDDRCPAWLRLQDEANAAGYGVDEHDFGAWPTVLDTVVGTSTIEVELIIGSDGSAVRLVTDGSLLHLEPVASVEVTGSGPLPCRLDSIATYSIDER